MQGVGPSSTRAQTGLYHTRSHKVVFLDLKTKNTFVDYGVTHGTRHDTVRGPAWTEEGHGDFPPAATQTRQDVRPLDLTTTEVNECPNS